MKFVFFLFSILIFVLISNCHKSHLKNSSLPFSIVPMPIPKFPYDLENNLPIFKQSKENINSYPKKQLKNQNIQPNKNSECICDKNIGCPNCDTDYQDNYERNIRNCPCSSQILNCPICNVGKAIRQIHEAAAKEVLHFLNKFF